MVNNRPHELFLPTAAQLAAARAGVGMSVQALAERCSLGVNTVRRAEAGGAGVITLVNAERLVSTLEGLGVTFLVADQAGPGVRFAGEPQSS